MIDVTEHDQLPWGRVDESGTVYVREAGGERAVGQYPDATPEEALAYFERKFTDLAGQVTLLEQRAKGGAPAADIAKAVATLSSALAEANAVGDLAALRGRLERLSGTVSELTEKQTEQAKAAVAAAIVERTQLVTEAEELAAQDPATVQWKQMTSRFDELLARWKQQQAEGPRVPKSESNELWKRLRAARSTVDANRRAFFAERDSVQKQARLAKEELVAKAEALAGKGADGIRDYRALLDRWKATGRTGKKSDDVLWDRFKAAGDVLYGAKAELDAAENEVFAQNLVLKRELLDGAAGILAETDRNKARNALLSLQRKWDEIGKVPRAEQKAVDAKLSEFEQHVRRLEKEHWDRNQPDGVAEKMREAVAEKERRLEKARELGDEAKIAEAQTALEFARQMLSVTRD